MQLSNAFRYSVCNLPQPIADMHLRVKYQDYQNLYLEVGEIGKTTRKTVGDDR